jgi:hypothetical protein
MAVLKGKLNLAHGAVNQNAAKTLNRAQAHARACAGSEDAESKFFKEL